VSLEVTPGEAVLVTGPNGSGKTTLLRCLATALRPHMGSIRFNGQDLWAERAKLRSRIGFLAHASRLYNDLTARENLQVWARLGGIRNDVDEVLGWVDLPADRHEAVSTYSAGMRRRLSMAIALLERPALMLVDEPFATVDRDGRALMGKVLTQMREAGTTMVMASHMPRAAGRFCTTAIHLDGGQIVWRGSPKDTPAMSGGV
jgi:heme exporter protein A